MRARVIARTPLLYRLGADASIDRPGHVRAGSSLRRVGERLVVVQDDANFLAVLSHDGTVDAITLPAGPGGKRQFDEGRGNKKHKFDLEAALTVATSEGEELWAFGSGSSAVRTRIIRWREGEPRVCEAKRWYQYLVEQKSFSGAELNIEGALIHRDELLIFQRGNGAPTNTHAALDAVGVFDFGAFHAFVEAPETAEIPTLRATRRYDLGAVDGARLTFTDAALINDQVYYSAAAEASPDATRDGPVTAVAIGVFDESDFSAQWALLEREDGSPLLDKVEGISAGKNPQTLYAVVDRDEPDLPAELLEVQLLGAW